MKYTNYFTDLTHTEAGVNYIKKRVDLFSKDDIYKIGKVFKKSNIEVMNQKVYKLNLKLIRCIKKKKLDAKNK